MYNCISFFRRRATAKTIATSSKTGRRNTNTRTQVKMTLIVATDLFCWMPICIMGFLQIAGNRSQYQNTSGGVKDHYNYWRVAISCCLSRKCSKLLMKSYSTATCMCVCELEIQTSIFIRLEPTKTFTPETRKRNERAVTKDSKTAIRLLDPP